MRISWALAFAALVLSGVPVSAGQVGDLAGVLPGDRWVYEVTDEITGDLQQTVSVVVLDVSEKEINTRTSWRGAQRPRQVVFDPAWNCIDDSVWKYKPSDGTGVRLPLQVGNEWRFDSMAAHFQNGTTFRITGQSKVTAQEKVTTSAGTFDTYKVESTARQINSNDQTKSATVHSTVWYAPTVNRWVRKTYTLQIEGRLRESRTEELTDYSRKP